MKGVLGDQYGKIGPVVGRKFREENVYSAYQKNVFNPRTDAQQVQRIRFRTLSQMAHSFACGAIFGFRTAAKGTNRSPRNLFQATNFPTISASVNPESISIDYTAVVVSKGALANVNFGIPNFDNPNNVTISFSEFGAPCQRTAGDRVFVYVYCPDAKQGILSGETKIEDAKVSVDVPAAWNGLKVYVWGFTRNQGAASEELGIPAGEASDSFYCGSGTIG